MKRSSRVRTLRGTITVDAGAQAKRDLILDDGRINVGYKVTGFHFWQSDMIGASNAGGAQATLLMSADATYSLSEAEDNREIAWAAYNTGTGFSIDYYTLIDPDHVVVRDLVITIPQNSIQGANTVRYNYLINLDEYEISDQEAIISIIKEESQDVDN